MEALKPSSISPSQLLTVLPRCSASRNPNPIYVPFNSRRLLPFSSFPLTISSNDQKFKLFSTATVPATSVYESVDAPAVVDGAKSEQENEKFDWYAQWYPFAPVCDLDKRVPHGKKVMGLDIVVWWDRNEGKWQVFNDSCPHRMAPLSEGRIDPQGRLQCVYHGWCFNGAGDCKFIPQAPPEGPPVHTSKRACVAVYPSIEQNGIVWFWPSTDPQYKDIASQKKPPFIPELDDPSYTSALASRDFLYGYEVMIENLLDPAHVPYAHYTILPAIRSEYREGGIPLDIDVESFGINGFSSKLEYVGYGKFVAPCVLVVYPSFQEERRLINLVICIPVSPGRSRVIWSFPKNYKTWIDRIMPRWLNHVRQHMILDSDLMLLHLEEYKLREAGPMNWHKACYVPIKSDGQVIAFRNWLRKYSNGQVDWGMKYSGALPPSLPREQLMDRYWSHVVNCSSCRVAVKGLKALEIALQVISLASIGIAATLKQCVISTSKRSGLVCLAILCFATSRWLAHFIYKSFYVHDYNHGVV